MTEREGFARRWSRLKRQAAEPAVPAPQPAPAPAPPPEPVTPPPAAEVPLEDIMGWVRRGAPEAWAQLALRRLWRSDPAIASHIGPADYAWDWNAEGGVPGWGPMRAADDIVKLLARAIGEPEPAAEQAPTPAVEAQAEPSERVSDDGEAAPAALKLPPPAPSRHRRRGGRAAPV